MNVSLLFHYTQLIFFAKKCFKTYGFYQLKISSNSFSPESSPRIRSGEGAFTAQAVVWEGDLSQCRVLGTTTPVLVDGAELERDAVDHRRVYSLLS